MLSLYRAFFDYEGIKRLWLLWCINGVILKHLYTNKLESYHAKTKHHNYRAQC